MRLKKKLLILLSVICFQTSFSQTALQPEIGKPCPDFTLDYVTHYPQKKVSLNDFKGKWLFIDFWFSGCYSCIQSFPKVSLLQQEFNDKIQFMLVGINDKRTNGNIEKMFEKLRAKNGLNIAAAYDSVLAHRWGLRSMPHIVIVDPQGIVRFITDGKDMNAEKIQGLLDGKQVSFFEKDIERKSFDRTLNTSNTLWHSTFAKYNGEAFLGQYLNIDEYVSAAVDEGKGLQFVAANLKWLYNTAYLGQDFYFVLDSLYSEVYPFPFLELQDTTLFDYKSPKNYSEGRYNYSLYIQPEQFTKENVMKYMQQDLQRVFGYHAVVENRKVPVWKLAAKPGAAERIKTKGGVRYNNAYQLMNAFTEYMVTNVPMREFTRFLFAYLNEKERYRFIDETGITGNIDFNIDADMTDVEDVRKELQKQGLDLVLGEREMKVLVIRDAK